ncbi:MAG TPA: alanine racemase [Gemmatimonadaceae bacterium]|nr:alanine racemase [Gemmatimonadaceae bacterium]
METQRTRAWVEIDLGALQRNGAAMAARAGRALLPMIKADAYGTGAVRAAGALEPLAPWGFGVATVAEGVELREAGITRRVIVFTPLTADDLRTAHARALTPALDTAQQMRCWHELGGGAWHLSIDTGMNRAGVRWDDMASLGDLPRAMPPEGAFTHFHSAERDAQSVTEQEDRFRRAIGELPARPRYLHAENSAAIARRHGSPWDLVRPGVFLYGVDCGAAAGGAPEAVVQLRSRVVAVRTVPPGESVSYDATFRAPDERRIATLAIGYADGYRRALSNRGSVLIRGVEAPVVGVVTMDMTMIDVTDVPCEVGDVATLIGGDGALERTVRSVAATADVSPYELLTGLGSRLERIYHGPA